MNSAGSQSEQCLVEEEKNLDYWMFHSFRFRSSHASDGTVELHTMFIRDRKYYGRVPKKTELDVTNYFLFKINKYPHPISTCLKFKNIMAFKIRSVVKFLETCRPTVIESLVLKAEEGGTLYSPKILMPSLVRFIPQLTGVISLSHFKFSNKQMSMLFSNIRVIAFLKFEECFMETSEIEILSHNKSSIDYLRFENCCSESLSNWHEHPERLEAIFKFICNSHLSSGINSLLFVSQLEASIFQALAWKYPFEMVRVEVRASSDAKGICIYSGQYEESQSRIEHQEQSTCWSCSIF
ncbi:unnamed protein product [Moneuplotes crassus]|uniref:Uncharacterized protein n=1 Tax=Euplotes crassus TaxID=5936 RepID=A0AAD2D052_EUPCR|nr:unnamed protein product [Moneuplotes crassus]